MRNGEHRQIYSTYFNALESLQGDGEFQLILGHAHKDKDECLIGKLFLRAYEMQIARCVNQPSTIEREIDMGDIGMQTCTVEYTYQSTRGSDEVNIVAVYLQLETVRQDVMEALSNETLDEWEELIRHEERIAYESARADHEFDRRREESLFGGDAA